MIILDTCVIRSMKLDSSEAHLLRAIRDTKAERVGVPWMVVEERSAQLAIKYRETYRKAAQALDQLRRDAPGPVPELGEPEEDAVRERYREQLRELADILPTSEAALREGVVRESNALPPAGVKKDMKVGARDVSIWLSAVEYAKSNPDEKVYFVSSNTKDFTAGDGPYPYPMSKDLEGVSDRFVHLAQLADLLKVVAPSVEVAPERVMELLPLSIKHFRKAVMAHWGSPVQAMFTPFPALSMSSGTTKAAHGWYGTDQTTQLKALNVTAVQGYRLGDQDWCTASVQWQVMGWTRFTDRVDMGCTIWETSILLPLAESGPPRILRSEEPKAPSGPASVDWPGSGLLRDQPHLPEVQRLLDSLKSNSRLERALAMLNYALQNFDRLRPGEQQAALQDVLDGTLPDVPGEPWDSDTEEWPDSPEGD
ncbi:PIN domain-containing protein [Streptomyces anulatus]